MGLRANVAIRHNGTWTHCGSNGMGYSLGKWLALGVEPALAVMRFHPVWDRDEWQLESSCEAGALIDLDAKDLLVFLDVDYGRREAVLQAYRRTWPGWTVRWAYNGLADITDALGVNRSAICREAWDATELDEDGPLTFLITVDSTAYAVSGWPPPWELGPALVDRLADLPQQSEVTEIPRGGLHLDPVGRHAVVWSVYRVEGLAERFSERWPGWTVEFVEDRYREQELLSGITFPDPAPAVDEGTFDLVREIVRLWAKATLEHCHRWKARRSEFEWMYGMDDAGLSNTDMQELVDAVLGPGRHGRDGNKFLDVAAWGRDEFG